MNNLTAAAVFVFAFAPCFPALATPPIALVCRVSDIRPGPGMDLSDPTYLFELKLLKSDALEIVIAGGRITFRRNGSTWINSALAGEDQYWTAAWDISENILSVDLRVFGRESLNRYKIRIDRFTGHFENEFWMTNENPYFTESGKCQLLDRKLF